MRFPTPPPPPPLPPPPPPSDVVDAAIDAINSMASSDESHSNATPLGGGPPISSGSKQAPVVGVKVIWVPGPPAPFVPVAVPDPAFLMDMAARAGARASQGTGDSADGSAPTSYDLAGAAEQALNTPRSRRTPVSRLDSRPLALAAHGVAILLTTKTGASAVAPALVAYVAVVIGPGEKAPSSVQTAPTWNAIQAILSSFGGVVRDASRRVAIDRTRHVLHVSLIPGVTAAGRLLGQGAASAERAARDQLISALREHAIRR